MLQANNHRVMGSSNHANDEYDFEDDDNMSPNESEESDEGEKFNNLFAIFRLRFSCVKETVTYFLSLTDVCYKKIPF